MARALAQCPVCGSGLTISELHCTSCATRISGAFDSCRFCKAGPDQLAFVETFLRCEGNLSRVEKELSISYPTVRNRLASALAALGLTATGTQPEPATAPKTHDVRPDRSTERRSVIERVSDGSITAEEAAELLRSLA